MTRSTFRARLSAAALAAVLALSGGALAACSSDDNSAGEKSNTTPSSSTATGHDHDAQTALYATMRTIWEQHMEWTWAAVVAFAADSPALQPSLDRLLKVPGDTGKAVAAYYGDEAGDKVAALLTDHFTLALPVLTAAKKGDDAGLKTALDAWYANAQDIADFLSAANPDNWPQDTVRDMMKAHIDQTTAYASDILGGKWDAAIKKYDEAEHHMMMLSDTLSSGIIAQFPDKF